MAEIVTRIVIGNNKFKDNMDRFLSDIGQEWHEKDTVDDVIIKICNYYAKQGHRCESIMIPNATVNRPMIIQFVSDPNAKRLQYYEIEHDVVFIRNAATKVRIINNERDKYVWLNYDIRSSV
jgi:hypothetical protein